MTETPDAEDRAGSTSVVMAVRNGERFLKEAIASALAQLDERSELLVVDDGSTDRTAALLATVDDRRLRTVAGAGKGVSAARNLGLAAARGDYVAFLDHDDLWPAGRQAVLTKALRDHPEAGAAYGRILVRAEADAVQPERATRLHGQHLSTNISASLFRTTFVRGVGGFSEDLRLGEDADFHNRLTEAGLITLRCECDALIYRLHGGNATNEDIAVKQSLIEVARRRLARAQRVRRESLR